MRVSEACEGSCWGIGLTLVLLNSGRHCCFVIKLEVEHVQAQLRERLELVFRSDHGVKFCCCDQVRARQEVGKYGTAASRVQLMT